MHISPYGTLFFFGEQEIGHKIYERPAQPFEELVDKPSAEFVTAVLSSLSVAIRARSTFRPQLPTLDVTLASENGQRIISITPRMGTTIDEQHTSIIPGNGHLWDIFSRNRGEVSYWLWKKQCVVVIKPVWPIR